jgi:hypothetical protein
MTAPLVPRTYEEWKHCITELCRIPLTPAFIEARIDALVDPKDYGTQRFVQTWGIAHLERVRAWFERAQRESGGIRHPEATG